MIGLHQEQEVSFTARRRQGSPQETFTAVLRYVPDPPRLDEADQEQAVHAWIEDELTGSFLDEVLGSAPSIENLALHLYTGGARLLSGLTEVRVSPEPGVWAGYRP
ncbi:hypothetical protein [Streptacidiphilus sp. EB103A]|uniref:hypothetical protein n=1 Tax=Streptacidiphilus sp. EB103A TaxID=3156275 RepID=UPI0035131316